MTYSYKIEQAIRAATVLHKEQVRKGDTPFPYVSHLFSVALMVAEHTDDEDTIVAALLHDALEDTDYTADELENDFGTKVRDIVLTLSEPKQLHGKSATWKERKTEYNKQLKQGPEEALLVAAADKIHNMRTMIEDNFDNHTSFIANFGGRLNDRLVAYQEASNIINRRLKSQILTEFNNVFNEYKDFIAHVRDKSET